MDFVDNSFMLSGVSLLSLAETYGAPLYIYDTARMASRFAQLTTAFQNAPVKFKYACKALTNQNILRFLRVSIQASIILFGQCFTILTTKL